MEKKPDEDENLASSPEVENQHFLSDYPFWKSWAEFLFKMIIPFWQNPFPGTTVYDTSRSWNSRVPKISMKFRDELFFFNPQIAVTEFTLPFKGKKNSEESHLWSKASVRWPCAKCFHMPFVFKVKNEAWRGRIRENNQGATCLLEFTALLQGTGYNLKLENNLSYSSPLWNTISV